MLLLFAGPPLAAATCGRAAPIHLFPRPPQAIREAAIAERARTKERTRAALQAPLRLVIDLDFDGLMNVSEVGVSLFRLGPCISISSITRLGLAAGCRCAGDKRGENVPRAAARAQRQRRSRP
jgi:hypothetical protein